MTSSESGDFTPTSPRTTIHAALHVTIEDWVSHSRNFAEKAGIPPSTLSKFRNNQRNITVGTLQAILNALDPEEYAYFLEMLTRGNQLLDENIAELPEGSGKRPPDPKTLKRAFHALVASYCIQCSSDEQLELLAVIHQASVKNAKLLGED